MDQRAFETAKAAYQRGDWNYAALLLLAAQNEEEAAGEACHLRGNALMKLARFDEAASSYQRALSDKSYGHSSALLCNLGRAYLAAKRPEAALEPLKKTLQDTSYPTPYKAQAALGDAYFALGDIKEAGIAYRAASIDEKNPNPAASLLKLGNCFMELDRPIDAIEVFRTALDFSNPAQNQNCIYAALGSAYLAADRLNEGVDAYQKATADGSYVLSSEDQTRFIAAQNALLSSGSDHPSETEILLQKTGYASNSQSFDPLDPLGKSAEFIPSPDTSSFFEPLTDEKIKELEREQEPIKKKKRHGLLKFFIGLITILILCFALGALAFSQGYGWPLAETVVSDVFKAQSNHADIAPYLSQTANKQELSKLIPAGATPKIVGINRSISQVVARVEARLAQGGTQLYEFHFVRGDLRLGSLPLGPLSWKISGLKVVYSSQDEAGVQASKSDTNATDPNSEDKKAEKDSKKNQDGSADIKDTNKDSKESSTTSSSDESSSISGSSSSNSSKEESSSSSK